MLTFEEALQEAQAKEKVFLLQFGSPSVDDATFAKWKEIVEKNEDLKVVSVERNGDSKNEAKIVATKASVQSLKKLWMVERVWKQ